MNEQHRHQCWDSYVFDGEKHYLLTIRACLACVIDKRELDGPTLHSLRDEYESLGEDGGEG